MTNDPNQDEINRWFNGAVVPMGDDLSVDAQTEIKRAIDADDYARVKALLQNERIQILGNTFGPHECAGKTKKGIAVVARELGEDKVPEVLHIRAVILHKNNALRALLEDPRVREYINCQVEMHPAAFLPMTDFKEFKPKSGISHGGAVHYAVRASNLEGLKILHEHGADLNLEKPIFGGVSFCAPLDEIDFEALQKKTVDPVIGEFLKAHGGVKTPPPDFKKILRRNMPHLYRPAPPKDPQPPVITRPDSGSIPRPNEGVLGWLTDVIIGNFDPPAFD